MKQDVYSKQHFLTLLKSYFEAYSEKYALNYNLIIYNQI